MAKIFLGLGSNLGDKKGNIYEAIELLKGKISGVTVAKLYETEPQYYKKQDTFINAVLSGYTDESPKKLLEFVKGIERQIGRQERFRYGPREVDVDILFYGDRVQEDAALTIPHPLLQEREFVLRPFMDLEPDFVHPVLKKTIKELYNILLIF